MSLRSVVALQAAYALAAVLLLALADIAAPLRRLSPVTGAAVGLGAGGALYLVLARGARPRRRHRPLLALALAAAASEEVVWRWGALAGTAPHFGWGGALALSTFGFAYRHSRSDQLPSYLLLGAAFGGIFLATGQLVAAVGAHAGYNALVLLGRRR